MTQKQNGQTPLVPLVPMTQKQKGEAPFVSLVPMTQKQNGQTPLVFLFQAVYRAYDTSRLYRDLKLRAAIVKNKELIHLPGEEVHVTATTPKHTKRNPRRRARCGSSWYNYQKRKGSPRLHPEQQQYCSSGGGGAAPPLDPEQQQ
eukprot:scaffold18531_cov85-Isochrysis_galbana.AAC.3